MNQKNSLIKLEKKKALYLRNFLEIFDALSLDEPRVRSVYPTRVEFSSDLGICYIYFSAYSNEENSDGAEHVFNQALALLKLYKPSIRKSFASSIRSRYTPDVYFRFDTKRAKVDKIHLLLAEVQQEIKSYQESNEDE